MLEIFEREWFLDKSLGTQLQALDFAVEVILGRDDKYGYRRELLIILYGLA